MTRLGRVPCEPLPAEFESDLLELDQLLQARAARTSIPRDVADLVYDATVGLVVRRQEPLPLWHRRTIRYTTWGRLAAAASIALAFLVGAWTMQTPAVEAATTTASLTPEMVQVIFDGAGGDTSLLNVLSDGSDVGFVHDTRDLGYRDLVGELDRLEMDM